MKHWRPSSLQTWLIRFAGILVLLVCISKVVALHAGPKLLAATEPLTQITYLKLITGAVVVEAVVGLTAVFFPAARISAWFLACLGISLAGYRSARWAIGIEAPCKCLGQLLDWWPWASRHEGLLSWTTIVIVIVAGGTAVLRANNPSAEIQKSR